MFEILSTTRFALTSGADSGESVFDWFSELLKERLTVDFGQYDNLGLTDLSLGRIRMAVIAAFVAVIIASFVITLNRGVYGVLIERLNGENCHSPETAKTLGELGLGKNSAIRAAISQGSIYKGLVFCRSKDEFDTERIRENLEATADGLPPSVKKRYRFDFTRDRFYIPVKSSFAAEQKFEKKGSRLPMAIFVSVAAAVGLFLALFLLADILAFLDNFAGMMSAFAS
ncbi:MAG: hypothetical protein ILO42_06015 [Clostridia bacterium]|nr:hypothetical protein [Clostridia bacterium]